MQQRIGRQTTKLATAAVLTIGLALGAANPIAHAATGTRGRTALIETLSESIQSESEVSKVGADCMARSMVTQFGLERLIELGLSTGSNFEITDLSKSDQRRFAGIAIDCGILIEGIVKAADDDGITLSSTTKICLRRSFSTQRAQLIDLVVAQFAGISPTTAQQSKLSATLIKCLSKSELKALQNS